jgi:exonuclease III
VQAEIELQQLNNNRSNQNDIDTQKEITQFITQEKRKFVETNNSIPNHKKLSSVQTNIAQQVCQDTQSEQYMDRRQTQTQDNSNDYIQSESRDQEEANTPSFTKHTNIVNLATHNIRGITTQTGQDNFLEEIIERKISVVGISETKLTIDNQKFVFNNTKHYKCFSSAGTTKPMGSGVLLLIEKRLERFIASTTKIEGYLIAVSLESKKHKIFIAQVYLPCDPKESKKIQKEMEKIISQKIQKKYEIVLMGDFNAAVNPRKDRLQKDPESMFSPSDKPEIGIFNHLISLGLTDIQQAWEGENTTYTWTNKQSASRIDYIWTTKKLAIGLLKFKNVPFKDITNSDHSLLQMSLPLENILFTTPDSSRGKQTKQKILELNKTSEKQWDKFKERVDKKTIESNLQKEITKVFDRELTDNEATAIINNTWSKFENIIVTSAFCCLQCVTKVQNNSSNTHSLKRITEKKTTEFKQYRSVIKILTKWQTSPDYPKDLQAPTMWKSLKNIHSNTGMPSGLPSSTSDLEQIWRNNSDREKFTEQLRITAKYLKNICLKEEKRRVRKEIKEAIDERCLNLQINQRKIVQSLTNNFQEKIQIDRIKVRDTQGEEYIETLDKEVLKQTEEHYKKAFGKRATNFQSLSKSWKDQYKPRNFIKQEWFESLEKEILLEEIEDVLHNLPNNKAAGPSKIKYEMLKHLGHKGKEVLRLFFNLFLKTSKTPLSWKQSLLYPISKGKDWECNLDNTRPIVLLEVTRKSFTKIITNRLAKICKENNILRGPNFAGLPGESTSEPIHLLNNICEDARENSKELWILFQDTAKAYDTISLEMIENLSCELKYPQKSQN